MMGRGARNFILLTRSEGTCERARPFLNELKAAGCVVAARSCDFGSLSDLEEVVHSCQESMPPIMGVLNCGMALHVSSHCFIPRGEQSLTCCRIPSLI